MIHSNLSCISREVEGITEFETRASLRCPLATRADTHQPADRRITLDGWQTLIAGRP